MVIVHCQKFLAILVPLSAITEHLEMIINVARLEAIFLSGEERLWADKAIWEIWVDDNIFNKGDNVARII